MAPSCAAGLPVGKHPDISLGSDNHGLALFRDIETSGQALVVTDHGRPALEFGPHRRRRQTAKAGPGGVGHQLQPLAVPLVSADSKIRTYSHVQTLW